MWQRYIYAIEILFNLNLCCPIDDAIFCLHQTTPTKLLDVPVTSQVNGGITLKVRVPDDLSIRFKSQVILVSLVVVSQLKYICEIIYA